MDKDVQLLYEHLIVLNQQVAEIAQLTTVNIALLRDQVIALEKRVNTIEDDVF